MVANKKMIEDEIERAGLEDLLLADQNVIPVLCKSISKQKNEDPAEMIRLVCLHGQSIHAVLNKKCITKKMLSDYLCRLNTAHPSASGTKSDLIEKIICSWKDRFTGASNSGPTPNVVINIHNVVHMGHPVTPSLQVLAEKFVSWFCEKINGNSLEPLDLWTDVTSCIRFVDSTGSIQDEEFDGSDAVHQSFYQLINGLGFRLRPNVTNLGVQGRMNKFGLVMVAGCGTVIRSGRLAGVFEGAFGLMTESADDIWKLKHSRLLIRSVDEMTTTPFEPQLEGCDTLKEILELPSIPYQ